MQLPFARHMKINPMHYDQNFCAEACDVSCCQWRLSILEEMQNNNNIQLFTLIPPPQSSLYFFLRAFAVRLIWCWRPWRYLLFIVTYSYIGIAKNWSHKRRSSPPTGQTLWPKAKNKGGLLGEKPIAGEQPWKQTVFRHENPPKMHTLSINFISFTAEMHCIC